MAERGRPKKEVTTKKTKIVGTQQYVNQATGEIEDFQVIKFEDSDFNFAKIWMGLILTSLEAIGNQKIKVLNYLVENMDTKNRVVATQQEISESTGVSYPIVNQTLKLLEESGFLIKQTRLYMINPNCIFRGRHKSRMNVLLTYEEAKGKGKAAASGSDGEGKKTSKTQKPKTKKVSTPKQKKSAKSEDSAPTDNSYQQINIFGTEDIVTEGSVH